MRRLFFKKKPRQEPEPKLCSDCGLICGPNVNVVGHQCRKCYDIYVWERNFRRTRHQAEIAVDIAWDGYIPQRSRQVTIASESDAYYTDMGWHILSYD